MKFSPYVWRRDRSKQRNSQLLTSTEAELSARANWQRLTERSSPKTIWRFAPDLHLCNFFLISFKVRRRSDLHIIDPLTFCINRDLLEEAFGLSFLLFLAKDHFCVSQARDSCRGPRSSAWFITDSSLHQHERQRLHQHGCFNSINNSKFKFSTFDLDFQTVILSSSKLGIFENTYLFPKLRAEDCSCRRLGSPRSGWQPDFFLIEQLEI